MIPAGLKTPATPFIPSGVASMESATSTLRDRLATFATDVCSAYKIADALIDGIIAALRLDRFSAHSTFEIELVLADTRTDVAETARARAPRPRSSR